MLLIFLATCLILHFTKLGFFCLIHGGHIIILLNKPDCLHSLLPILLHGIIHITLKLPDALQYILPLPFKGFLL